MKLAIAADHAGFELKENLRAFLGKLGYEVLDLGTDTADYPSDYPDFALKIGDAILTHKADRGILVCGSGVGATIAANKIHGIYACLCHDTYSAHQGVEHDNINVLCLGARIIGSELAREVTKAFLAATFSTEERHQRRVGKTLEIEKNDGPAKPA